MTTIPPDPAHAAEAARQTKEILRGAVDLISAGELEARLLRSLREGRPLRVKLGVDPTSNRLHLGFTVVLNKLRTFQDLGHRAVLIIGDATALVGDPTGRNETRPRLTEAEVDRNAATYLEQAGKVIDVAKAEIRRNGEWLKRLGFADMIGLAAQATVARLLERDDFAKRFAAGAPIHLHELVYPLLQGRDSVEVRADVELGGTDQLFNLLMGRHLQAAAGQEPQVCLTTPLLLGLDGQKKMSKSYGNDVGITESPEEMMLKIMRLDDGQMRDWLTLVTRVSAARIEEILLAGRNPRDAKLDLGRAVVALYHGDEAAEAAVRSWLKVVSQREVPEALQEIRLGSSEPVLAIGPVELLRAAGWTGSNSEARRWLQERSVRLDDRVIEDPAVALELRGGEILRRGRQKVGRIILG